MKPLRKILLGDAVTSAQRLPLAKRLLRQIKVGNPAYRRKAISLADGSQIFVSTAPFGDKIIINSVFGEFYLIDSGQHRVLVLGLDGTPKYQFGSYGSGPGEFMAPRWVMRYENKVYVADQGNQRIQVFTTSGQYLESHDLGFYPFDFDIAEGYIAVTGNWATEIGVKVFDLSFNEVFTKKNGANFPASVIPFGEVYTPLDEFYNGVFSIAIGGGKIYVGTNVLIRYTEWTVVNCIKVLTPATGDVEYVWYPSMTERIDYPGFNYRNSSIEAMAYYAGRLYFTQLPSASLYADTVFITSETGTGLQVIKTFGLQAQSIEDETDDKFHYQTSLYFGTRSIAVGDGYILVGEAGSNPDTIPDATTLSDRDRSMDRIKVFDGNGNFIRNFGRAGDGPGEWRRSFGCFFK